MNLTDKYHFRTYQWSYGEERKTIEPILISFYQKYFHFYQLLYFVCGKEKSILGVRTYFLDENTIEFNAVSESELTSVFKAKNFIDFDLLLILYQKRQNQILSKIYFHD